MNGIYACPNCGGNGFLRRRCGCREAACGHEPFGGDPSDPHDGLFLKYWVRRTDGGSEEGEKHADCEYFVLDWEHDEHAVAAMKTYAQSCRAEAPALADDLERKIERVEAKWRMREEKS